MRLAIRGREVSVCQQLSQASSGREHVRSILQEEERFSSYRVFKTSMWNQPRSNYEVHFCVASKGWSIITRLYIYISYIYIIMVCIYISNCSQSALEGSLSTERGGRPVSCRNSKGMVFHFGTFKKTTFCPSGASNSPAF